MAPTSVIQPPFAVGDPAPRRPQMCCYPACPKPATRAIFDGEPAFDHDTYACEAHLGDMLSDADEQHVYRLPPSMD